MKQAISSFIGGIKGWKRSKKVFTAIIALIAIIAVKVLSAQFLYTEIGYKPVETDEEFRMALFNFDNNKHGTPKEGLLLDIK